MCPPEIVNQIVSLIVGGSAFARRLTSYPTSTGKVVFPTAGPYVDVLFPPGSLRRVTVGPGAHADLRRRGVVELLKSKGLDEVEVEVSKVPLRT